jgi:hypothetical protein
MTAILSYARISAEGLDQVWAEQGPVQSRFTHWAELGAGLPGESGLPPLKGRYFSADPSPRFGRMDLLCKLGLGAAELCMAHAPDLTRQDMALVGASMLGCLEVDAEYHDRLLKGGPAGASPALFVYTLPSMFVGEIAIKFGIRGRATLINAGRLSAVAALVNGARLIEKGRAKSALVVAAEAVEQAARDLDFVERGLSGAAAWLLAPGSGGICGLSNVRYGVAEGKRLAGGAEGFGLTHLQALEEALQAGHGTLCCGEGANAITFELSARK